MRRSLVPALLLTLLLSTLATACQSHLGVSVSGSGVGQNGTDQTSEVFKESARVPAPDLSGTTLTGTSLDVSSFKGKVVVLNFWASWCNPCRGEAPELVKVANATKALGVQFIGIDLKDDRSKALSTTRAEGVPYPSIFDQAGQLLLKFGASAPQQPPTTLILDRQGRVAARFVEPVVASELLIPVETIAKEPA